MNKPPVVIFMVIMSIFLGAYSAIASERLSLSTTPYEEMPTNIKNSEYYMQQLYVQEKRDFDIKLSQKKNNNPKIPLQNWKKTAPSAQMQKNGIEVID